MHENVETLAWMDAETRKRAFDKLATVRNKIGYPATWRNYDALTVERASHAANVARASAFERTRQLAKIGKPVDRDEWQMTPPTVNAYYDASLNEMVFAAGILQFPFFDNRLSMAMNYGGIGMVMGHELTHGFDDEGRLFDHEGNMRDWWSETSGAEFDARAKCVEAQYDAYEAVPDGRVNGRLTLGENIADIGGMKLAYKAFRAQAHDEATIGGFTPDQQFFIGFAQAWCANVREEALRLMLATNPHAPPRFRVIGAVANSPAFAEAFSCEAGSPMVRAEADRCEVW
jgi:endothelin-converting enzyme/putative endopeptidase